MLRSLFLYARFSLGTIFSKRLPCLVRELYRYHLKGNRYYKGVEADARQKKLHMARAVNWLLLAQESTPDDGMGSYHLTRRWSASYPETTGYIIPTLLQYADFNNDTNIAERAIRAADWLLDIQKPSGGWQGGRVNEHKKEVVFNTAQVIRGLIPVFKLTRDQKYLDSAIRAGDWLCRMQNDDGSWTRYALMGEHRVYDSYVDYPLLMLHMETGLEKYRNHARRNLDWIVKEKQQANGWFTDADNTQKKNHKPILHTIAYTIEGLLDCGIYLEERDYIEAASKAADVLKEKFDRDGFLNGRFDQHWKGGEHMILTGCAQISIVWSKMAHYSGNSTYAESAARMNSLLVQLQWNSRRKSSREMFGAISGSYPFWGRYEPFAFPNWATKYLADALMLEEQARKQ